jgi:hypothetical protein
MQGSRGPPNTKLSSPTPSILLWERRTSSYNWVIAPADIPYILRSVSRDIGWERFCCKFVRPTCIPSTSMNMGDVSSEGKGIITRHVFGKASASCPSFIDRLYCPADSSNFMQQSRCHLPASPRSTTDVGILLYILRSKVFARPSAIPVSYSRCCCSIGMH